MQHWRNGLLGAVQTGVRHGLSCAGCCWVLMGMLCPLGMTDVAAMGAVSALILAERTAPLREKHVRLSGDAFVV